MSHADLILFFNGSSWTFWTFSVLYFFVIVYLLPFSFNRVVFKTYIIFFAVSAYIDEVSNVYYSILVMFLVGRFASFTCFVGNQFSSSLGNLMLLKGPTVSHYVKQ